MRPFAPTSCPLALAHARTSVIVAIECLNSHERARVTVHAHGDVPCGLFLGPGIRLLEVPHPPGVLVQNTPPTHQLTGTRVIGHRWIVPSRLPSSNWATMSSIFCRTPAARAL